MIWNLLTSDQYVFVHFCFLDGLAVVFYRLNDQTERLKEEDRESINTQLPHIFQLHTELPDHSGSPWIYTAIVTETHPEFFGLTAASDQELYFEKLWEEGWKWRVVFAAETELVTKGGSMRAPC